MDPLRTFRVDFRWSSRSPRARPGGPLVRAAAVAALAAALVGVLGMGGSAEVSPLRVRTIASGQRASAGGTDGVWLARSDAELRESVAARIQGFVVPPEPAQPAIDFAREVVVGAVLGQRPTGGYTVEVVAGRVSGTTLEVTLREVKPPPDAMTIQMLTTPWTLAAVDLGGARVDRVVGRDEQGNAWTPRSTTTGGPVAR
jgi:hypothetical protein